LSVKITRDVIADLWPLYAAGEASPDTRALVDAFLEEHPEVADTLLEMPELGGGVAPSPDVEVRALERTRDLVMGNSWMQGLRLLAIALIVLAFVRSARGEVPNSTPLFLANIAAAAICGTVYLLWVSRARQRALSPRK
jgi:hypothetical protein